ncbi:unnamed protein product [Triticum turgidum subsp. durum]|uniref:Uncharacterized protein n=1 Tax=Triticum turgidum subsp. durum TaxID=4567 RepID=A0A9R0QHB1_TRITD|nr:unnamed protein product [Triticum turgidum subsp. durum]
MAEMTAILTDTLVVMFSRAISTWLIVKKATRSGPPGEQARLEEVSLNSYVLLQTYILMGVTGLGYLALTWSTVVLLGGFVTSLGNKDFWCLTGISMVQAASVYVITNKGARFHVMRLFHLPENFMTSVKFEEF